MLTKTIGSTVTCPARFIQPSPTEVSCKTVYDPYDRYQTNQGFLSVLIKKNVHRYLVTCLPLPVFVGVVIAVLAQFSAPRKPVVVTDQAVLTACLTTVRTMSLTVIAKIFHAPFACAHVITVVAKHIVTAVARDIILTIWTELLPPTAPTTGLAVFDANVTKQRIASFTHEILITVFFPWGAEQAALPTHAAPEALCASELPSIQRRNELDQR